MFPPVDQADPSGLLGVGADLEPGTLLAAYRQGVFPMPIGRGRRIGWWSPDPRGVLPLDRLRVSRSLRRSTSRYDVHCDRAFTEVILACGDSSRPDGWITPPIVDAYVALHELGWAHSVEAWSNGELVGGLYGVAIGGLFAGESMFHRATDASKVALVGLVERLRQWGYGLLDVQWSTPHLASLGVIDVPRAEYVNRLVGALRMSPNAGWMRQ